MKELVIDGSFEDINLSVFDSKELIYDLHLHSPHTHSKILTDIFDYAFHSLSIGIEDIGRLYCCIGPGKYTSLRVVLASIKGMFFDKLEYVYSVSSLDLMASEEFFNEPFRIICETSRTKTYFSDYTLNNGFIERLGEIGSALKNEAAKTGYKIIQRNYIGSVRNIFRLKPEYFKKVDLYALTPLY